MNSNRRSPASARRKAEADTIRQLQQDMLEGKQRLSLVDSETTAATPCPYDPPATEETLP